MSIHKKRIALALLFAVMAVSLCLSAFIFAQAAAQPYVIHGTAGVTAAAENGGYRIQGDAGANSNSKFAYNGRVNTKVGFGFDFSYNFDMGTGATASNRWFAVAVNRAQRDTDGNVTDAALQISETAENKNGIQILLGAGADWSEWTVGLQFTVYAGGQMQQPFTLMHQFGTDTSGGPEGSEAEMKSGAWVAWALRTGKTVHFDFENVAASSLYRITLSYEDYAVSVDVPYANVGGALDGDSIVGFIQQNTVATPAEQNYWVQEVENDSDIFGISLDKTQLNVSEGSSAQLKATIDLLDESTGESQAITWSSDDDEIAAVENGVVQGISKGVTTVRATLANGMSAACEVTVGEAPSVSATGVPQSAVQFEDVSLPDPVVSPGDFGGSEYTVKVLIGGGDEITLTEKPYTFSPAVPGSYTVQYVVDFATGITAQSPEYTIAVSAADLPVLDQWQTAGSGTSTQSVYATADGKGIVGTGSVGAAGETDRSVAKYIYTVPMNLEASIMFDVTLDLDLTNFDSDEGNGDQYRSFGIVLNQAPLLEDGSIDASKMDKVLTLDDGITGVQVAFAKAGTWGEWAEGLRWEAYDTAGAVGYNHFHTTNSSGTNSIPDLPEGDEKYSLARKISAGEPFRVIIRTEGDELLFQADNILWRFPLSDVAFASGGNVYLGFISDNSNGVSQVNFSITNLYNGFIDSVSFADAGESETLEIGQTLTLTPQIKWKDGITGTEPGADDTIVWSSSNEDVASVENGVVTALKPGRTAIRAASAEGKYAEITVVVPAKSISLAQTEQTIKVGKGFTLSVTVDPADTVVTFESEDPAIATVNENGDVVGIAAGTVKITAYAGDKSAVCTVTVEDYTLESLAFAQESYTVAVGERIQLEVTVSDTEVPLEWSVSDTEIAEITGTGYIIGKMAGTVTVTVTGGGKTATCQVTFTEPEQTGGGCNSFAGSAWAGGALLLAGAAGVCVCIKRRGDAE